MSPAVQNPYTFYCIILLRKQDQLLEIDKKISTRPNKFCLILSWLNNEVIWWQYCRRSVKRWAHQRMGPPLLEVKVFFLNFSKMIMKTQLHRVSSVIKSHALPQWRRPTFFGSCVDLQESSNCSLAFKKIRLGKQRDYS